MILGGSVLGGDDLDGGVDEFPVATMGAISSVLGCDLGGASGNAILPVLGATRPVLLVRSPCCFSFSLFYFPRVEII